MRVLVVGGAGYIGSHMTRLLREEGHEPVVVDNFSSGFRDAVEGAETIEADLAERAQIERVFAARRFDGVMHRLANPGRLPLQVIEVQTGAYLGEDDIERHHDAYGRADLALAPAPKAQGGRA